MADTLILIDILAENKVEILTCIRETFNLMDGWVYAAEFVPIESRFYYFNLTHKRFCYYRLNETYLDTMGVDEVVINDLADISRLLEFIYDNCDTLRGSSILKNPYQHSFVTQPVMVHIPEQTMEAIEEMCNEFISGTKKHILTYSDDHMDSMMSLQEAHWSGE